MHTTRSRSRLLRFLTGDGDAAGAAAPAPSQGPGGDTTGDGAAAHSPQDGGFVPPSSQAELDRIIGERLARERAKYSDYEDLRRKAGAAEQAEEAARDAQARAEAAEATAMRSEVAAAKGVPSQFLAGTDREAVEAAADALLAWRDSTRGQAPLGPGATTPRGRDAGAAGGRGGGLEAGRAWFTEHFSRRGGSGS
ncbi:hypothetical protein D5R93_05755 [Actinomyces lilanjuaniae]|uniref:Uncharacterized protein n=1 Tax=Actinomyces lilanjuaniae TaxID=2321394 RepID=A0ABN5PSM2_9ACTO|nr:hypothetical protein [Actinomyces lilanjuaniae]AYD89676.1 hypothetical protein D5R93_05755 [Actinomyces lilanjuaniae]